MKKCHGKKKIIRTLYLQAMTTFKKVNNHRFLRDCLKRKLKSMGAGKVKIPSRIVNYSGLSYIPHVILVYTS